VFTLFVDTDMDILDTPLHSSLVVCFTYFSYVAFNIGLCSRVTIATAHTHPLLLCKIVDTLWVP